MAPKPPYGYKVHGGVIESKGEYLAPIFLYPIPHGDLCFILECYYVQHLVYSFHSTIE